jgi:hypothetical protein
MDEPPWSSFMERAVNWIDRGPWRFAIVLAAYTAVMLAAAAALLVRLSY